MLPYFFLEKCLDFTSQIFSYHKPIWYSENSIILETQAFCLREFMPETYYGKRILILPPQAGHSSTIADFDNNKSLVQTALKQGCIAYVIDWKSCTIDRKNESVNDLIDQVDQCVSFCRNTKNSTNISLVGLCMGGWLAAIYTYLNFDKIKNLIVAGAPIDAHADSSNSLVYKAIEIYPLSMFKMFVDIGGGLMRGDFLLTGWKNGNFYERYIGDYIKLWDACGTPNLNNIAKFRDWYECTQNVAGKWYLECVEKIFFNNDLWHGKMIVKNEYIKFQDLDLKIPIISIAGENDDITPPKQALAFNGEHYLIKDVGHIGVFMSGKSQSIWSKIFANL